MVNVLAEPRLLPIAEMHKKHIYASIDISMNISTYRFVYAIDSSIHAPI